MSQNDFSHFSLADFIHNALGNLIVLVPVSAKNMLIGLHEICATRWLKILAGLQFTKNNTAPKSKNDLQQKYDFFVQKYFCHKMIFDIFHWRPSFKMHWKI